MTYWFAMGDYGVFVWGAYGITLSVLLFNVVWAKIQRKQMIKKLRAFFLRQNS